MRKKNSDKVFKSQERSRFFRLTSDGECLFYPWGYPGESYKVSDQHRKLLANFYFLFACLLALFCVAQNSYYNFAIVTLHEKTWIGLTGWIFFPLFYCVGMYFLCRKLEPSHVKENKTPLVFYVFLVLLFIHIPILTLLIITSLNSPIFIYAVLLRFFFVAFLFFLLIKSYFNKGYFFTDK